MARDAEIRIRLNADEARRQSKAFSQSLRQDFARVIDVYSVAKDAAAAFGAVLISTGRLAAQYEKEIAQIKTIVTDAGTSHAALSQQISALAQTYGGSAIQQAKGFYEVMSSGAKDAAEAQRLLVQANRLAIAGGTEVATASKGLLSVLNSYGFAYERAREVSDAYFVAVRDGTASVGELATEISKVAPLAAQLGIDYREIFAAQAVLTKTGMSAADATTRLRGVLEAVISPTAEGAKLARKLGLDFSAAALAAKGLGGFLQDLRAKTHGSSEQMKILLGRSEALQGALILAADGGGALELAWQNMTRASGATASALKEMQGTLSYKWDLFSAGVESVQLALGGLAKSGSSVSAVLGILTPQLTELSRSISSSQAAEDLNKISVAFLRLGMAAVDVAGMINSVTAPIHAIWGEIALIVTHITTSFWDTIIRLPELVRLQIESNFGATKAVRERAKQEMLAIQREQAEMTADINRGYESLQSDSLERMLANSKGSMDLLLAEIKSGKKAVRRELEDYGPPLPPPLIYGPEQESASEKEARAKKLADAKALSEAFAEMLRDADMDAADLRREALEQQERDDQALIRSLQKQEDAYARAISKKHERISSLEAKAKAKEKREELKSAREKEQRDLVRADAFGQAVAGIIGAGVDSVAQGKTAVLQATGQMFGGILQQVGLDLVATGVSALFKGVIASTGWLAGLVTGPAAIGTGLAIAGIGAAVKAGATPDAGSIAAMAPGGGGGGSGGAGSFSRDGLGFSDPASSRAGRSSDSAASASQPSSQIQNLQVNVSVQGFIAGSETGVARQLSDLLRRNQALKGR